VFLGHFLIDTVQMFFTSGYYSIQLCFLQTLLDCIENFSDDFPSISPGCFGCFEQDLVAGRIGKTETQLLQLLVDVFQAESMSNRSINFQSFLGDTVLFLR